LEPVCTGGAVSDQPSSNGLDHTERTDYREIIKINANTIATHASTIATHAGTIATHAGSIATLSNTNASQHRLIEAMVVDNKATKK
jgi:hypothetical protein